MSDFQKACIELGAELQRARKGTRTLDAKIGRFIAGAPNGGILRATDDDFETLPPFTQFVDAAILLLPPTCVWAVRSASDSKERGGWEARVGQHDRAKDQEVTMGATPALAIAAACIQHQAKYRHALINLDFWWECDARAERASAEYHDRLICDFLRDVAA